MSSNSRYELYNTVTCSRSLDLHYLLTFFLTRAVTDAWSPAYMYSLNLGVVMVLTFVTIAWITCVGTSSFLPGVEFQSSSWWPGTLGGREPTNATPSLLQQWTRDAVTVHARWVNYFYCQSKVLSKTWTFWPFRVAGIILLTMYATVPSQAYFCSKSPPHRLARCSIRWDLFIFFFIYTFFAATTAATVSSGVTNNRLYL